MCIYLIRGCWTIRREHCLLRCQIIQFCWPTIALFHNIMLSREMVFNSCLRKNRADRQERKTTNAIWPSELRALRFQYNIWQKFTTRTLTTKPAENAVYSFLIKPHTDTILDHISCQNIKFPLFSHLAKHGVLFLVLFLQPRLVWSKGLKFAYREAIT